MKELISINEIFKDRGQPTFSYVKRNNGEFETKLSNAIDAKGSLCLVTGPSKTGKTTLYTEVAKTRNLTTLQIRCTNNSSSQELWRRGLEKIDFERIKQTQSQKTSQIQFHNEASASMSWAWLARLSGKLSLGTSNSFQESEIKEKFLAEANPEHLIPILKNCPIILVVEDFHYLSFSVQKEVFQQWKSFIDNEVSVIVVGTSHHAADIAFSNKDLVGRIEHIELQNWNIQDLKEIPRKGLKDFGLSIPENALKILAEESVGLPIIIQSTCLELFRQNKVNSLSYDKNDNKALIKSLKFTNRLIFQTLHDVAIHKYGTFDLMYDRLCRGPRQKARKYNTYELILLTFCEGEIDFQITRERLEQKVAELPLQEGQMPPKASISSTLKALGPFQEKLGTQVLEWSESNQRLYITEPSFLFYLRWREEKTYQPGLKEILQSFFSFIKT
jgi:hypothetical protein